MKQEHYIVALVGVGAVLVLYVLWKESQGPAVASNGAVPVPLGGGQPAYPNAQPIDMGNVTINEAPAPPALLYNAPTGEPFPSVVITDGTAQSSCGCPDASCETAGVPVTRQKISSEVLQAGYDNMQSYIAKTGTQITSGVEAARVTFSQSTKAPPAPALTGGGTLAA